MASVGGGGEGYILRILQVVQIMFSGISLTCVCREGI